MNFQYHNARKSWIGLDRGLQNGRTPVVIQIDFQFQPDWKPP